MAKPRTLVLALGNELAGDDAVALHAARRIKRHCGPDIALQETGEAGLALLDFVIGYERLLILDSVCCEPEAVGRVHAFAITDLRAVSAPSPHYAGLPEMKRIADACAMPFPEEVCAVAVGIAQPDQIRSGLTPEVAAALPEMTRRAMAVLRGWGHRLAEPMD